MTESTDVVLTYWAEHRQQFRQSENQRAVLTNYVLVIATAVSGFIVQQDLRPLTLFLSILIAVIGIYGALTTAKYHERANYHLSQARALTRALVDTGNLPDYDAALDAARRAHNAKFPRLQRLRLNRLWTALHVGIAVLRGRIGRCHAGSSRLMTE